MERLFFVLLLFALLAAGCTGSRGTASEGTTPGAALAGPTWTLIAFGEAAGAGTLMEEMEITAVFSEEEHRIAGSAGCNRYFGSYEAGARHLSLSQVGATKRACRPPLMEQEQAYLAALGSVAQWERTGAGRLTLMNQVEEPLLHFTTPSAEGEDSAGALVGTGWQLLQVETRAGETVTPGAGAAYTLTFQPGGRFGGQADCNSYGGGYETQAGGALALSRVAATLAACGPSSQAGVFINILNAVDGYNRRGNRLRLRASTGGALVFERVTGGMGMAPQQTGRTFVYECTDPEGEDFSFTTRTGPGESAVWLPARFSAEDTQEERYLVLGQVRAASGAKYEGDGVVVWTKGMKEALLEVEGETFTDCTSNPQRAPWAEARRRGVDFRAVGQEPGWHLEIREGARIRFVYAYGEREAATPAPEPTAAEGRTVYHAETEAHTLTVTITEEPCADAMSGTRFPATVTVALDGETYRGCGRSLR